MSVNERIGESRQIKTITSDTDNGRKHNIAGDGVTSFKEPITETDIPTSVPQHSAMQHEIMKPVWEMAAKFEEDCFYYPGNPLTQEKFANAKNTVLSDIDFDNENILLFCDNTFKQDATEGFTITDYAVYDYVLNKEGEIFYKCIPLSTIETVEIDDDLVKIESDDDCIFLGAYQLRKKNAKF